MKILGRRTAERPSALSRTTSSQTPSPGRVTPRARRHSTPVEYLQRTAGNAAVAKLFGGGRTVARPLEASTRDRLEGRFGTDLSQVRLWLDARAAASVAAPAFTVGDDVVVDPVRYRPGTVAGDVLLAHEIAHVVQQRAGNGGASNAALEADADRSAIAAATGQQARGFLTRLGAALSLQRCIRSCSDEEEALAKRFQRETDPVTLERMTRGATDDQLRRIQEVDPSGVHADALAWERAMRARDYQQILELNGRTDAGFRTAFAPRILAEITAGRASIKIESTDDDFTRLVTSSLSSLLEIESGFKLIVELLATAQPVVLTPAKGQEPQTTEATDREAASLQQRDGRYVRGRGSGSTIKVNVATAHNEVTLGREDGRPAIIEQEGVATVGHELIHALHNARGENIAPMLPPAMLRGLASGAGLVRDPATGEPESAEELRTITGQTRFSRVVGTGAPDQPVDYGLPPGITENDLRRDLGLPERTSHFGAQGWITIARQGVRTVDQLVARYRVNGAAVPAAAAVLIRSMLQARGMDAILRLGESSEINVPHPEHVKMHVRFVARRPEVADALEGLTVQ